MAAYLFVHFIGEQQDGEQVYFSLSKDGLHWQDLNGGQPVLRSRIGEKGARDPFCVRHPETGRYYLIATDLCIHAGKGWGVAQHSGSRDLIVWESDDLVNWTEERAVTVGIDGAGCVWAPETVWDPEREAFFVFWASMVQEDGDEHAKQRIYGSYTSDFRSFSPAQKYIERDNHVIDTTLIHTGDCWYRFSKDETSKRILTDRAARLDGDFEAVHVPALDEYDWVEGPQIYRLADGSFCLIVDQFGAGLGYLPMLADSLPSDATAVDFRVLDASEYDMGQTKKRHGGVIEIADADYDRLLANLS